MIVLLKARSNRHEDLVFDVFSQSCNIPFKRFVRTSDVVISADNVSGVYRKGSSSAAEAVNLRKSLASQQQVGESGTVIAGPGAKYPFRSAQRATEVYGGDPNNWVKKSSSSYLAPDGKRIETHWIENLKTGQRVEYKTKVDYQSRYERLQ